MLSIEAFQISLDPFQSFNHPLLSDDSGPAWMPKAIGYRGKTLFGRDSISNHSYDYYYLVWRISALFIVYPKQNFKVVCIDGYSASMAESALESGDWVSLTPEELNGLIASL